MAFHIQIPPIIVFIYLDLDDVHMPSQKAQLLLSIATIAVLAGVSAFVVTHLVGNDSVSGYGNVNAEGDSGVESLTGSGRYYEESFASLSVVMKDGYCFDGWYDSEGNKVSASETYTFLVEGDTDLTAKTILGYPVDAYRMHGVKDVLVVGRNAPAGEVTLRAVMEPGYRFAGWYTVNGFRSYADTYTTDKDFIPITIAKSDSTEYDGTVKFSYSLKQSFQEDTVYWIITDWRTGEFVDSFRGTSSIDTTIHPGKYNLRVMGTKTAGGNVDSTQQETVTGEVKKEFRWFFEGEWHSAVWTTDYSDYDGYQNSSIDRSPITYYSRMEFIDYSSDTVSLFADYLMEQSEGMTDLQRANYVLAFVQQCITYQIDTDFCGESEYWKYPYETLFDGRGDCEDTTILYCALMKGMGYDTAMLLYLGEEYIGKGHAAAGLATDYVSGGSYYDKDGVHYYYCETTNVGYKVGDSASGCDTAYVYVVK